jgi:DNA-binding NtrC family response regulator
MDAARSSILVVDDDVDICANLSDILADHDYRVDTATDAVRALELVSRNRYDVALLDLKLPGMDGVELFRRIRKVQPEAVGVIVTAYATPEAAMSAARAGASQVMPKPVNFHKLLTLVRDALDQPLVLVVDDDLDLCDLLNDLFRERHYRVCVAHDVRTAEMRLKERRFHVVLVDLKLPQGDGRDVVHQVRKVDENARIVIITGHRSETEDQINQLLSEGAETVCYKPFDVKQLIDTVDRLAQSVRQTAPR